MCVCGVGRWFCKIYRVEERPLYGIWESADGLLQFGWSIVTWRHGLLHENILSTHRISAAYIWSLPDPVVWEPAGLGYSF